MYSIKRKLQSAKNQDGLTSIMVVFIVMIILALISLSFAKLMNRQLKQTTDRELATQATYAAESGINDAKAYVNQQLRANVDPSTNNQCLDTSVLSNPPFVQEGNISGDYNNNANDHTDRYTCILLDSRPPELIYDIKAGQSSTFKFVPYNNNSSSLMDIDKMVFSWENQAKSAASLPLPNANAATHRLPKESEFNDTANCSNALDCTGMIEVTIYPIFNSNAGNNPTQEVLLSQSSRTYFLYPNGGAGTVSYQGYGGNGQFINGSCNNAVHPTLPYSNSTPRYCNAGIDNLPTGGGGARFYYVKVRALYTNLSVSVQASNSSNAPADLASAQTQIDATGKGNNVLKRISTRVYQGNNTLPEYTLQSMATICKRFKIPVNTGSPPVAALDDTGNDVDGACGVPPPSIPPPPPPSFKTNWYAWGSEGKPRCRPTAIDFPANFMSYCRIGPDANPKISYGGFIDPLYIWSDAADDTNINHVFRPEWVTSQLNPGTYKFTLSSYNHIWTDPGWTSQYPYSFRIRVYVNGVQVVANTFLPLQSDLRSIDDFITTFDIPASGPPPANGQYIVTIHWDNGQDGYNPAIKHDVNWVVRWLSLDQQ
jgi:hypothetical protein